MIIMWKGIILGKVSIWWVRITSYLMWKDLKVWKMKKDHHLVNTISQKMFIGQGKTSEVTMVYGIDDNFNYNINH